MKRFLLSAVLATTLAFTSCQFDDSDIWDKFGEMEESIRDHEQRISALEELCKQMNTNIEALQALVDALEKRDYVTNVSEVRSNGEVIGYTISFGKSDTITIYHGEDGKDGYTPQIGVMKDTDNIYYWTLDGEWLLDGKGNKIKAVGTDGADGKDGQDGTSGTDGKDGADGKNGVTPQLKIENDYWYVSYDNGATWVQLGKATGNDGVNGENGEDSDSIFKSVTQDDEYVYFNLADGTMITLPKHDKENIQFEDLQAKAICCKKWDTNNDGELSYAEAAAVTDIGDVFSENKNIIAFTELKHFTGITKIPANAFEGCTALWKVKIPDSVTSIGESAFEDCTSLTSVTIPDSVTSIGEYAFLGCTALPIIDGIRYADTYLVAAVDETRTLYTIKPGTRFIGTDAFSYCSSLTSVTIPDSVTSIGTDAFKDCTSLASVTIPDSVTSIGTDAFSYCTSLTSVTIPDSVTSIGQSVFYRCSSLKAFYGKFASADNRCLVIDGVLNSFAPAGLTEYTIPNGITSIGEFAFYFCTSLTSITIPDSVTSIGVCAFRFCRSLTSVTIPDSVTWIGGSAFEDCASLESVYCKAITPPTAGNNTFIYNNASGRKIYVPRNSVEAYKTASGWNQYASSIVGYDF